MCIKWPQLQRHKLPSLHSVRWNSRGILALIAFFLIPKWRDYLKTTCDFIATSLHGQRHGFQINTRSIQRIHTITCILLSPN